MLKVFCRSFDLRLYERSRAFYASLGIPMVRLTDQSADGYFYTMLADTGCDIAINIDEDCFLASPDAVIELVNLARRENYANIGCPDGGGATPRNGNPLVTNPFFNIFNLRLIREQAGSAKQIRQAVHAYAQQLPAHTTAHFEEPYYPFFLWLNQHFRTLFLPSKKHPDGWTTLLYMPDAGTLICAHTWLARFYSVPSFIVRHWQQNAGKQQQRIDACISEIAALRAAAGTPVTLPSCRLTDSLRYTADKSLRWCIKVPQRIANWPKKFIQRIQ